MLPFNHKVVLTLAAFVVIGALLRRSGGRGCAGGAPRVSSCWAICCSRWAIPGVKFVREVLIG